MPMKLVLLSSAGTYNVSCSKLEQHREFCLKIPFIIPPEEFITK